MDLLDGLIKIGEFVDHINDTAPSPLGRQVDEILIDITSLIQAGLIDNPEIRYQEPREEEDY